MSTRTWYGAAVAVPQVTYIELGGTYATGDTITLSIPSTGNTKSLILTVGSTTTIAQILADLADMVNGAAANNDESRSALGSEVGEWIDITATTDTTNNYLILTGPDDGQPFTVAKTTDSSLGTIATPVSDPSISPESPHDFDNADNWSGGAVPVTGDTIVFNGEAAEPLKYGLSQTGVAPAKIVIDSTFTKSIGLPSINTDNAAYPYNEYRTTYLTLGTTASLDLDIDARNAGNIRIDTNTQAVTCAVLSSGASSETGVAPVSLRGNSSSSTYHIEDASVDICADTGESGAASAVNVVGSRSIVRIGDSVSLTSLTVSGGNVTCDSAITTLVATGGTVTTRGSGTITTATLDGGTLEPESTGTITTLTVGNGGVLDSSKTLVGKTITNIALYAGATFNDPNGTITATNGLDVYCTTDEVSWKLPARRTYTLSTI